jgi:hypothetical protein
MTRRLLLSAAVAMFFAGCVGESGSVGPSIDTSRPKIDTGVPVDPYSPCTVLSTCCPTADIYCVGDPEKGPSICTCSSLWDCSQSPKRCEQDLQEPPGGGTWDCNWTEQIYTCTGTSTTAPKGGGWTCKQGSDGKWVCTKSPPNPTNRPAGAGVWTCSVNKASKKMVCERDAPKQPPPTETNCADGIDNDGDGLVDCKDPDCPACSPPTCPTGMECCDGIDNNGDGKIDEGNICGTLGAGTPCPPGAYQSCDCYGGVHRKCQADGIWGVCKVDGSCKVAEITTHSQCKSFQHCDLGTCVTGDQAGHCVHHNDCGTGLVCDLGECIADHYVPCP